jgi:F0F1-type ATP synthase delta subunit
MVFMANLFENSETLQMFTQNAGIGIKEIKAFNQGLKETGADISPVTSRFIEVLAENKRLVYIREISERFQKLYVQASKAEKISKVQIISAYKLTGEEEQQVLHALKANPQSQGKDFVLEFKIDE